MFPLISFDIIDHRTADAMLAEWGHFLGGCKRPFGRQSFGLHLEGELIAVAVSASTVNKKVAEHLGAAQVADLLVGPFDHAVTLAGPAVLDLAGGGEAETLLRARF